MSSAFLYRDLVCYNFFFFWLMEIAKYTTPTEQQWPCVSSLRDWHIYPKREPQDLALASDSSFS